VNINLITDWFPVTIVVLSIVSVVLAIGWFDGAWKWVDGCVTSPTGDHSLAFWATAFKTSLPWLSWRLGLTPAPKALPADCDPPIL
jgi:hypothetical protein